MSHSLTLLFKNILGAAVKKRCLFFYTATFDKEDMAFWGILFQYAIEIADCINFL